MSTSFFLKPPRRGDVGRLEPLVTGYEDRKVTWYENHGIQTDGAHRSMLYQCIGVFAGPLPNDGYNVVTD
jgi:hypothetical protein